jgi:hypothetical protein
LNHIPLASKAAKQNREFPSHRPDQGLPQSRPFAVSDFCVEIDCRWNAIRYQADNQSHKIDWLMKMWLAHLDHPYPGKSLPYLIDDKARPLEPPFVFPVPEDP